MRFLPYKTRPISKTIQTAASTPDISEQIPVTLVDGEVHDFWRVDPERLKGALIR